VGSSVGVWVGENDGLSVLGGRVVGISVGSAVGLVVGTSVGHRVGLSVATLHPSLEQQHLYPTESSELAAPFVPKAWPGHDHSLVQPQSWLAHTPVAACGVASADLDADEDAVVDAGAATGNGVKTWFPEVSMPSLSSSFLTVSTRCFIGAVLPAEAPTLIFRLILIFLVAGLDGTLTTGEAASAGLGVDASAVAGGCGRMRVGAGNGLPAAFAGDVVALARHAPQVFWHFVRIKWLCVQNGFADGQYDRISGQLAPPHFDFAP